MNKLFNHYQKIKKYRGYTLLEVTLVVTILGMLLGASLLPLNRQLEAKKDKHDQEQLEILKEAVLTYAMSNKTIPILVIASRNNSIYQSVLPAGRPYLPCPDVDGDGLEDRLRENDDKIRLITSARAIGGVPTRSSTDTTLFFDATSLATLTLTRTSNPLIHTNALPSATALQVGACVSDKGSIPWATLGTNPQDQYGNRFTYRVDPAFSNSIIGFGPESRVDVFDPRQPLVLVTVSGNVIPSYQRRRINGYYITRNPNVRNADDNPTLMCIGPIADRNGCRTSIATLSFANKILGLNSTIAIGTSQTVAAITVYDKNTEGLLAARSYRRGDVMNGPAFVIVAHGKNGLGAIFHHAGDNTRTSGNKFDCRIDNQRHYEMKYADIENSDSFDLCDTAFPLTLSQTGLPRNHSFVDMPKHSTQTSNFDDTLVYMSDTEVIYKVSKLANKTFPIYIPPVLP